MSGDHTAVVVKVEQFLHRHKGLALTRDVAKAVEAPELLTFHILSWLHDLGLIFRSRRSSYPYELWGRNL